MATIKPGPANRRGPAHTGRVIVDTYRGQIRVRSWPRKQTAAERAKKRDREEWFRQANILTKYVIPEQAIIAIEATRGTPFMPRDLLVMAMAGRVFGYREPGGRTIYPMGARSDVSASLDVFTQTVGGLLARGSEFWEAVDPGTAGQALVSQGPNALPAWADPASAVAVARVEANSAQALTAGVNTKLTFGSVPFDADGLWDAANSRFVIPAGVTKAELVAGTRAVSLGTANTEQLSISKNGTGVAQTAVFGNQQFTHTVSSGLLACAPTDFFEVFAFAASVRTLVGDARKFFSVKLYR